MKLGGYPFRSTISHASEKGTFFMNDGEYIFLKGENHMTQEKMASQFSTGVKTDGLKVIGAGFGRTGTFSLKDALEMLGFGQCYHMAEVFKHPEHIAHWEAVFRGESIDWQDLFHGYQAAVDWPSCTFYKQLMLAYPAAKVLLSVRDPDTWYESVKHTIYRGRSDGSTPLAPSSSLPSDSMQLNIAAAKPMNNQIVWHGTFHDRFEDKEYAISVFNQHYEEVKAYVPPEKLLVYHVKEGWEPLCAFLGVPVPDVSFPYLNDRESFLVR